MNFLKARFCQESKPSETNDFQQTIYTLRSFVKKLISNKELKAFLDEKTLQYNHPDFIKTDPISIPHLFSLKQDIEIAAFLSATIAWGKRENIIKNAFKLVQWMDHSPYQFIMQHTETDLKPFSKFVHRTFNGNDCIFFIKALNHLYSRSGSLENYFSGFEQTKEAISNFRTHFLSIKHEARIEKHVANPVKGSSAKRLNMFLRWMSRKDSRGVDFGIWNDIDPARLMIPLDVHTGNVARKLGLLERKQNDWKAVEELTTKLKNYAPDDPVKYDYALFGLGIFEGF